MALSRPQLIDHGMFSQPRYEAVFGDIPLNATGKYSYTFSRFPAAEAMIMLLTPGRPPLEAIQNLDTELRLRMVGQDGTVHCAGAGSLRDRLPERLKISSSDRVDGVSHDSCGWLRLRGCNPCRAGGVDLASGRDHAQRAPRRHRERRCSLYASAARPGAYAREALVTSLPNGIAVATVVSENRHEGIRITKIVWGGIPTLLCFL
jgi:hypothetical protein